MIEKILHFWFKELQPTQWWNIDYQLDEFIRSNFLEIHQKATQGELWEWRNNAQGRLAEIIVLDQFSRNIYRGQPQAFAADPIALVLAQEAIHNKAHLGLPIQQRAFLYLPFMHSESKIIHEIALKLFSEPGLEHNLAYELEHKKVIDQFHRYPHRNKILNRISTPEEEKFLQTHHGW